MTTRLLRRLAGRAGMRLGVAVCVVRPAGVAAVATAAAAAAVTAASPAIALAAAAPHRQMPHSTGAVPGRGLTLAQAPAGLPAAVRRTLGLPAVAAAASQQAKLTAADAAANDSFGWSVAVSGSTAVVGAYGKNSNTGAAYVFTRSGSTWSQRAKLPATGVAAGDYFGYSVAVSGSTVVVGAPATSPNTGAAYVFTGSGSTWTQRAKLTATGGAPGDRFGYAVALSGSVAVIGATGSNSNTGAAYVFTGSGSTWTQQAKLTAADGAAGDYFGYAVALSGSTALVGAPGKSTSTGAAYVYAGSGSSWPQQAELTAADARAGDKFGISVAIAGPTAVVGAPLNNAGSGAAYVFTSPDLASSWPQQAKLTAAAAAPGDHFGNSVTLSGSTAAVGAPGKNSNTGTAYVFAGV